MYANFQSNGFSCTDENFKKKLKEKSKGFDIFSSAFTFTKSATLFFACVLKHFSHQRCKVASSISRFTSVYKIEVRQTDSKNKKKTHFAGFS
jgi:hypothetical protein